VSRLHDDEVPIGPGLVRRLLAGQHPELAGLPLRPVAAQGTDNLVYRLGPELAVRLPRKAGAVPALRREQRWLPAVGRNLPLAVPAPVAVGEPDEGYPFPWLVCRWVPGVPAPPRDLDAADARRLAEFVRALAAVDPGAGPRIGAGERAGPVAACDAATRTALDAVLRLQADGRIEPALLDRSRAERVWADAVRAPAWSGPGVWVHRDLYHGNLLTLGGTLCGVIDFGGLAVGDPAGDVMGAFHLLDPADRAVFGEVVGVDEATWARARGWVLNQGLQALPYYLDTHPGMVAMARRAITSAIGP
jgi:aminoglycoside phosphotransferase (APT) family kinase protein